MRMNRRSFITGVAAFFAAVKLAPLSAGGAIRELADHDASYCYAIARADIPAYSICSINNGVAEVLTTKSAYRALMVGVARASISSGSSGLFYIGSGPVKVLVSTQRAKFERE